MTRMFKLHSNMTRKTGTTTLHEALRTFMTMSRWIFFRMRNVSEKFVDKSKTHFMFNNFFLKPCALWDNVETRGTARKATDDIVIWRMRFACWINKATGTHTTYVTMTAFPRQQQIGEHASVLHLYVHCLSCLWWKQQTLPYTGIVYLRTSNYFLWPISSRDVWYWNENSAVLLGLLHLIYFFFNVTFNRFPCGFITSRGQFNCAHEVSSLIFKRINLCHIQQPSCFQHKIKLHHNCCPHLSPLSSLLDGRVLQSVKSVKFFRYSLLNICNLSNKAFAYCLHKFYLVMFRRVRKIAKHDN